VGRMPEFPMLPAIRAVLIIKPPFPASIGAAARSLIPRKMHFHSLPVRLSLIVRSLSVSLSLGCGCHMWMTQAGMLLRVVHLHNDIPWYRRRETLRDGTHNSRIQFGFTFC